jgi:hypothetical protein
VGQARDGKRVDGLRRAGRSICVGKMVTRRARHSRARQTILPTYKSVAVCRDSEGRALTPSNVLGRNDSSRMRTSQSFVCGKGEACLVIDMATLLIYMIYVNYGEWRIMGWVCR